MRVISLLDDIGLSELSMLLRARPQRTKDVRFLCLQSLYMQNMASWLEFRKTHI